MQVKQKKHLNFKSLRQHLSTVFSVVQDFRKVNFTDYSLHDALMSGFACMYFQDPSLNQFQERLKEINNKNNLQTLFKVKSIPSSNRMTELIDQVSSEKFHMIFKEFFTRLQRGKHLDQFKFLPNTYLLSLDGKQYYNSKKIRCEQCVVSRTTGENSVEQYTHGVLQPAIVSPDMRQVLPLMPEEISNQHGSTKQDCEINAAKRLLNNIKSDHPQANFTILGDSLFSKNPFIKKILENKYHYILVAKPSDHRYLFNYIQYKTINKLEYVDEKEVTHKFEWVNNVPINGDARAGCKGVNVNFLQYARERLAGSNKDSALLSIDQQSKLLITYKNSWVTDFEITQENVEQIMLAARARWKIENECFNTLTNQGYYVEHSYGHGFKNSCFNYFLLSLVAFYFHQIFELTDKLYIDCRKKFCSKKSLWETLRAYIRIIVFDAWEQLLNFALLPGSFKLEPQLTQPP